MRIGTRIVSAVLISTLLFSTEAGAANIMTDLTAGAGKKEASASVYTFLKVTSDASSTGSNRSSSSASTSSSSSTSTSTSTSSTSEYTSSAASSASDNDAPVGGTSFDRRGEAAEGASVSSSGAIYTESHDGTDDLDDIYDGLCIVKIDDSMSVKTEASEEAENAGYIYKDCIGEILEQKGSWTKIRSGNLEGWIKNSYLLYGTDVLDRIKEACMQVAVINTETLRVRKEASEDASIVALLGEGDEVDVVGKDEDDWTEIEYEDGTEGVGSGYVSNEYITLKMMYKTGETVEEVKAREEASKKASDESKKEEKKAEEKKAEEKKEDKKDEKKEEKKEDKKEDKSVSADVSGDTAQSANEIKPAEPETPAPAEPAEAPTPEEPKPEEAASEEAPAATDESAVAAPNDAYLLAALIQCECNGPYEAQLAVGAVVMNRVKSGYGSISKVIYAPHQFGPASSGKLARTMATGAISATAMQAANDAISGVSNIGSARYFRNVSSGHEGIVIGNHVYW